MAKLTANRLQELLEKERQFDEMMSAIKRLQTENNKAIKKTLTIPGWLNVMAEQQGINFSHALQEVLKEKLGIKDLL